MTEFMNDRIRITVIIGINEHERRGIIINKGCVARMPFVRLIAEIIKLIILHIIQRLAHLAWEFLLQRCFKNRQYRFQIAITRLHRS